MRTFAPLPNEVEFIRNQRIACRGQASWADEQNVPKAVTREKGAEIAAKFMTTFYHVQIGALETREFQTTPVPFWLICFSDAIKAPLRQMFFVVLPPDGAVVEPRVARRA